MRRGNGEGSVFKLSGKRRKPYAVRITVGWTSEGKQQYKYLGYYEGIREAKKALREYLVNPYELDHKNTTMIELFQEWAKTTTITPTTVKNYTSSFNQAKQLHNLKIRDVKIVHLENAMNELKPSMQGIYKYAIHQIYKLAMKYEIVNKDLSEFLQPEKRKQNTRKPFTMDQIEKIKTFDHRYNNITIILLYTGLRITELLEIKKENVHLSERYMIGGKKTKAGQDRIIPIHDQIYELIESYYNDSSKYLIENKGKPIHYRTFMTIYWERLKEYINCDQTPHCTRHTFITQADRCEMNKTSVKKIVGHSSGDITDHYTHKNIQDLLNEINKLKY